MKKILFLLIIGVFSCARETGSVNVTLNGSYAHVVAVENYLYAINSSELITFDISSPDDPIEIDRKNLDINVENIFLSNGILFVGSQQKLFIYKIQSDGIPVLKSDNDYFVTDGITACDPVIARGDYAYVTLSSRGSERINCIRRGTLFNELRIYNISDIENPELLSRLNLNFPKGLAIDNNYLFVCEAIDGFKVIDIEDPNSPIVLASIGKFNTYDVIAKNGLLMVVCPTEIRQYDYSDINNISYLSSIKL